MRIYVPTTLPRLRAALESGELGPAPLAAHAVTPQLREWYAAGDEEELEYVAMSAAALQSLRLLATDSGRAGGESGKGTPLGDDGRRRVVVAADVPDGDVTPGGRAGGGDAHASSGGSAAGAVRVSGVQVDRPVSLSSVVSAHVDDPGAAVEVAAAVAALPAAEAGDDDAQWLVDGLEDHELQWFARQELAAL